MENDHFVEYLESQFGRVEICADQVGITSIIFVKDKAQNTSSNAHTQQAVQQLQEYFKGERTQFNLSLHAKGTAFQQQVWQQLSKIDFGDTCSYADIAQRINNPKAVRAVGAANGKNPISIVVPCHRVIGSNGSLTGYAWGTPIKAGLLQLEGKTV